MFNLKNILFYLFLLSFPLNVGKHFISPRSFINGIPVDYLIPTVFLSDIFLLAFLIAAFFQDRPKFRDFKKIWQNPFFVFLLLLLPSVFFAVHKTAAIYKFVKLAEFVLLTLAIGSLGRFGFPRFTVPVLSSGVLLESFLALGQWLKQGSVFGYLPFGETELSPHPPLALVDFLGTVKLRSYGTFPHPNVLGGYLAIALPLFVFFVLSHLVPIWQRLLGWFVFSLALVSLFLSFSWVAWSAFVFGSVGVVLIFMGRVSRFLFFILSAAALSLFLSFLVSLFSSSDPSPRFLSLLRRVELGSVSWEMFKDSPFWGAGLNNFTVRLEDYKFISGFSRFLQPVHNIYLLVLSESGFLGFLGLFFLISSALKKIWLLRHNDSVKLLAVVFIQILFLGFFDHYLMTLQSGLFLFWGVLGLVRSAALPRERNSPKIR